MSYRGDDLELRLPLPRLSREDAGVDEAGLNGSMRPAPLARSGAIHVDDTLLACCNHAYDLALIHGAREVRLEHLLHAMTRVEPAAAILDQLRIRAGNLRRDTAAVIAAEAADAPAGSRAVRASLAFEDTLRRAAEQASLHDAPASVHDILRVILSDTRDTTGPALLLRAARDAEELERWCREAGREAAHARKSWPQRLDALEAGMEALRGELDATSKSTIGLVRDLHREMQAQLGQLSEAVTLLRKRVESLPRPASSEDFAQLNSRLDAVEHRWSRQASQVASAISNALLQRVMGLEATVRAQIERSEEATKAHEQMVNELYDALVKIGGNQQVLDSDLSTWRLESGGDMSIVSNQLQRVERTSAEVLRRVQALRRHALLKALSQRGRIKRWFIGTGKAMAGTANTFAQHSRKQAEGVGEMVHRVRLRAGSLLFRRP